MTRREAGAARRKLRAQEKARRRHFRHKQRWEKYKEDIAKERAGDKKAKIKNISRRVAALTFPMVLSVLGWTVINRILEQAVKASGLEREEDERGLREILIAALRGGIAGAISGLIFGPKGLVLGASIDAITSAFEEWSDQQAKKEAQKINAGRVKFKMSVKDYIDGNWIARINTETQLTSIARQAFNGFRSQIYRKYVPEYEKANLATPALRQAELARIKLLISKDIHNWFEQYRETSLNGLINAELAAKRIQYQFLDGQPALAKATMSMVQDTAEVRTLQLGRGHKTVDPRKYRGRRISIEIVEKINAVLDSVLADRKITPREQQLVTNALNLLTGKEELQIAGEVSDAPVARQTIEFQGIEIPTTAVPDNVVKALKKRLYDYSRAPKSQNYKHVGSADHVVSKLVDGFHREGKKIGVSLTRGQYERRTGNWIKTVARTEAQAAIADADQQAISESYTKYRYVAIIDEKTTDRCRHLDGKTFRADDLDGIRPPQHFNCRSELQPVASTPEKDRALASSARVKFDKWLKKQPAQLQEQIVGKNLMKAYKAGTYNPPPEWKVKRRYYVDRNGMPVVPTKDNIDKLQEKTRLIDVKFDPNLL